MTTTFRRSLAAQLVCAAWVVLGMGCSSADQGDDGSGDVRKECPPACNDENPCTLDTCDANGGCHHEDLVDGTSCDDGNACTQADACQSGLCRGVAVVCPPGDPCHGAGQCNPGTGTCSNPALPDGTACEDGDACTLSDTCASGTCVPGIPVVCAPPEQCQGAGHCDPANGGCSYPTLPEGTPCDDGDACTLSDACAAGKCFPGAPVVCVALDQCHLAGLCDPANGACSNPNAADGAACNDGNACTQSDTCQTGTCVGANPVTCAASDQCHVAGTCNPSNGACSSPNAADGTPCDDGNLCTHTDACVGGTCAGTNPVTCAPSDACHVAGACNPGTGLCSNPSAADGTSCSTGDACTTGETCSGGACGGGAPRDCSDGNACTLDTCDTVLGCGSTPLTCPAADATCSGTCTDVASGCANYVCADPLGCTIGYWKNHTAGWTSFTPDTMIGDVFQGQPTPEPLTVLGGDSLLQALAYQGGPGPLGGARILLRQAVAALLNASDPTVSLHFPLTTSEVIAQVVTALGQDRAAMIALAEELDEYNNASGGGCPLN